MKKLKPVEVKIALRQLAGWKKAGETIRKSYTFKNFYETMAFVNAVAWIAHEENHHPDLEVGYDECVITYSTHSVGGLTRNDFIGAGRVNGVKK